MGPPLPTREARGPQLEGHQQTHRVVAAPEPLPSLRRPPDETSASLLRGCTYSGQQQRQQAVLCRRLLDTLVTGPPGPHHQQQQQPLQQEQQQQQQQQQQQLLVSLASRASQCAEGGDARGATAAVLLFLKELAAAVGAAVGGLPRSQQQAAAASEVDRQAVAVIAAYSASSATANAAELRVQRHALACLSSLFRRSPLLASPGSPAVTEALGAAAAAAVTLQRVLGAEPRPKTHRGMQRHMQQQQQQQQHIVATGLAAAQPKQAALLRALLVSIYSLLAELLRARSAAAAAAAAGAAAVGGGAAAVSPGAEGRAASALQATVGEISIDLLLLLLPLSTAPPAAAAPQLLPPLQESEADAGMRLTAARGPAALSWRRGPSKGDSPPQGALLGAPQGVHHEASSTPRTPRSAALGGGADPEVGIHSVRAEGLRCVEALLRLSGRELFPYWGFLLHRRAARLTQQTAQAQWGPLISSALAASSQARGPLNRAPTRDVRAPRWAPPLQQGWQQQALDLWLWQLLGAEEEQQELPWALLATTDESAKVRKAALGCLCALLGAPPLKQWPDSSQAPCMHCGPRSLLMDATAWAQLVGPLGFRELHSAEARGEGPPQHSSCCCCALPSRQQQQAAGSGAYTSLSATVTKASRCAVHALFAVALNHLVGLRPACTAHAAETFASVEASPSGATAAPAEAAAAVQPLSSLARCTFSGVRTAGEQDSTGSLGAVALRGLSEALPALPLGLLPPGVTAAALLLAYPVVLLLEETLQEQRRRQLLLNPHAPTCSVCLGVEASETTGPEWSALNDAAAAVAQRARKGASTPPAAAATTAAAAAAAAAAADCESGSKRLDGADVSPCERQERGLGREGRLQEQQPDVRGWGGPFEAFASQVLQRGPSALRYVASCLALVAAVLSRRQRQPQAAEALLLPLSSTDVVAGPSCLAALACRAVHTLASLCCHSERGRSSAATSKQQQDEDCCCPEAPRPGFAKKGSKFGETGGEGLREDWSGNACKPSRCTGCERHAAALMEGLFSVLQATAKRYPQVLLLLKAPPPGLTTIGQKTEGAPCGSSWAPACGPGAQTDAAVDGPLVAMLRFVLVAPNPTIRTRAAAFAVELLQPASDAKQSIRQRGFAPADPGGFWRPPHSAEAAGGLPHAGATGGPPFAGSGEATLQASRRSLLDVLHTSLIVPLLEEGAPPSSEGGGGPPCSSSGHEAPPSERPALSTEQWGLACSLLCRLSSEEWHRLGLRSSQMLQVLCSFALPDKPRSVRLAAAAALGAFGVEAAQPQQAQSPLASGAPAGPPTAVSAAAIGAASAACADGLCGQPNSGGMREAVLCLLLQLSDPLPDVRAAALCALCEVAGRLQQLLQQQQQQQQQEQQEQQQLSEPIGHLWGAVLRAINDALQAGEKAAVAAAGLRAVGVVVPLLLLNESVHHEEASVRTATVEEACCVGGAHVYADEAVEAREEGRVAAREGNRGVDEEVIRSLALLECALRLRGETGHVHAQTAGVEGPHVGAPQETSSSCTGDALLHAKSERASASVPEAAAAGLRRLKLHWNACHSVRLIFSCPAASLILQDTCCRALLPAVWLAVCDCLSSSQLAKVRCHAAAALRAIAELLGLVSSRLSPNPQQPGAAPTLCMQLCCMRCLLHLLTEAWRAVEAAATKANLPAYPEDCGERGEPRAALRRYRESLRSHVEGLVASGLLACTQELLDAYHPTASLDNNSPPAGGRFEPHHPTDEPLTAQAAQAPTSLMIPCEICGAERNALPEAGAMASLRQTMKGAMEVVNS